MNLKCVGFKTFVSPVITSSAHELRLYEERSSFLDKHIS